jgi:hypothetical protein
MNKQDQKAFEEALQECLMLTSKVIDRFDLERGFIEGWEKAKAHFSTNKRIDLSEWPETPSDDVLEEWLKQRKRHKASVSKLVLKRIGKQLHLAADMGYTVDDCLLMCLEKGWRGFEANWMPLKAQPAQDIPYDQIVNAYNQILAPLTNKVFSINDQHRRGIAAIQAKVIDEFQAKQLISWLRFEKLFHPSFSTFEDICNKLEIPVED